MRRTEKTKTFGKEKPGMNDWIVKVLQIIAYTSAATYYIAKIIREIIMKDRH